MIGFLFFILLLFGFSHLFAQEPGIEVSPSSPYDRFTIYETLAFFWAGILGLIVIIKMKLKEIERVQSFGIDKDERDSPLIE
jgi:hypothetical protein